MILEIVWSLTVSCLSARAAMALAGKAYFDAVSKIGETAIVSPVSRELGEYYASLL